MRTLENICINTLEQYFRFQPRLAINIRPINGRFDFLLYKINKKEYPPIKKEIFDKINIRLLYIMLCSKDHTILNRSLSDSYERSFNIQMSMTEKYTNWYSIYGRNFFERNIRKARISFEKVFNTKKICICFNINLNEHFGKKFQACDLKKIYNKKMQTYITRINRRLTLNCTYIFLMEKCFDQLKFIIYNPSD